MKAISLLLLTLCLISCTQEPDLNLKITEPASTLENYIAARSQDGLLGPKPMIILDGGLMTMADLKLETFEFDEAASNTVAIVNKGDSEMLRVFGKAANDGLILIRTTGASDDKTSGESFKTDRILILVNGIPTHTTELKSMLPNKIAAVHVTKNSSLIPILNDIGYDAIIQVETK